MAGAAQWRVRHRGGSLQVTPLEHYRKSKPDLLRVLVIAAPSNTDTQASYEPLATLPSSADFLRGSDVRAELRSAIDGLGKRQDLAAAVLQFQMLFTTTAAQNIAAQTREIYEHLALELDAGSNFYLVEAQPSLWARSAFIRALITADLTPEVFEQEQFDGFGAARTLWGSTTYGLGPFLSPCILSLSPRMVGLMASRPQGTLIWTLEEALLGRQSPSNSLLDSMRANSAHFLLEDRFEEIPTSIASSVTRDFLNWWVDRLNLLLSLALDPSLFTASAEPHHHDPARQVAFLMSLQQVFNDVEQIAVSSRATNPERLRCLFDVLDTLEGLGVGAFRELTKPSSVKAALRDLRERIPASFADLALWRCDRAVAALDGVATGFVPRTRVTEHGLSGIPGSIGTETVPWNTVIPAYLRVRRNSSHSFAQSTLNDARSRSILLSHTGELPARIVDLAYLWLLVLMVHPERVIARHLVQSGRDAASGCAGLSAVAN